MSEGATQRRQVRYLLLTVAGMFAFAVFAMPPIYRVFCELTGLNGKPVAATASAGSAMRPDLDRRVTVEFVTSVDAGLPWQFSGERRAIEVHPGEVHQVSFRVRNLSEERVTGHAVPSVAPSVATSHLKKTQCFCFDRQTLAAGAALDMPVIFYIDPDLPRQVRTVTLAYRFYRQPDAGGKG